MLQYVKKHTTNICIVLFYFIILFISLSNAPLDQTAEKLLDETTVLYHYLKIGLT